MPSRPISEHRGTVTDRAGEVRAVPRVVVAVDRRRESARALAEAAETARRRGATLRVVTAYDDPNDPHAPKTIEQALSLHRRLRRGLQQATPWIGEVEFVIRRGPLHTLLALAGRSRNPAEPPSRHLAIVPTQSAASARSEGGMDAMSAHQCPRCPLRFSFRTELEWHLAEDHPSKVTEASAQPAAPTSGTSRVNGATAAPGPSPARAR